MTTNAKPPHTPHHCAISVSALLLTLLFGVVAAYFPSSATSEEVSPLRSPSMLWGANGHPLTNYKGVDFAAQLDLVAAMGLKSYRVDVIDERSVPRLRELVDLAKHRGITILPVITPNVNFAVSSPADLYKRARERAMAIITPFKDEIRVWELGNEIENFAIITACETRDNGEKYNCSWGPAGGVSPLDYFGPRWAKASAVLKGLSDGAKAVDPTIRRAIGTAGWGHTGAFERMLADGIEWEISVWHIYGQDPEWAFKILAQYGKPIWITEFNNPGGSRDGVEAQSAGLVRMMSRLAALAAKYRVEAAFIYELLDEPYWAPSYEATMGLVSLEPDGDVWRIGNPKSAYTTVRDFVAGVHPAAQANASEAAANMPSQSCMLAAPDNGDTSLSARITYAYCLILGREPDGDGHRAWLAALKGPTPVQEMLELMLLSPEFEARQASEIEADSKFVGVLYRLLLRRLPDDIGLSQYVAALEKKATTRTVVIKAFLSSHEFATRHPLLSSPLPSPTATR